MKCYSSWKRNNPDTVKGESITLTMVFSSFDKEDIDELEKSLPAGILISEYKREEQLNCDCYHPNDCGENRCWGTKEREICSCGGNKKHCNFY